MERQYLDLYSLFRHNPVAESYFQDLPNDVQDQIRTRRQQVNSFDDLQNYAGYIMKGED